MKLLKKMGDRYYIKLKCAYCGKLNPFAPSCGITTFDCDYCKKKNLIEVEFKAKFLAQKNEEK